MTNITTGARPLPSPHVIFIRYVLFAVFSGGANLASQELTVRLLPLLPIMGSVLVGTAIGFFVKYALEKRWIFFDNYNSHRDEIRKIFVYGLFGLVTTAFFWAVELGAWHIGGTEQAKYAGAIFGLSIGNWIKYLLDKHYVFGRRS